MKRPAFARLISDDVDIIHVIGDFGDAKTRNIDAGHIKYVAATEEHHNWDWAKGRTLCFHGRRHSRHPWAALRAGAELVIFVDLDGELRKWAREK